MVFRHVITDEIDTTAYNNASDKIRTRARGSTGYWSSSKTKSATSAMPS